MSAAPSIDLSAIPESQRAAVLAVLRERDALQETNRRLEHLIAELNQVLHGKRSEKLNDDERQLAFEDLETALAEAETRQDAETAPRTPPRRAARRNRGHLPESLPRVERVIEPSSLLCPCGCGEMHRIGEDRTERLDEPPRVYRRAKLSENCPLWNRHQRRRPRSRIHPSSASARCVWRWNTAMDIRAKLRR